MHGAVFGLISLAFRKLSLFYGTRSVKTYSIDSALILLVIAGGLYLSYIFEQKTFASNTIRISTFRTSSWRKHSENLDEEVALVF